MGELGGLRVILQVYGKVVFLNSINGGPDVSSAFLQT